MRLVSVMTGTKEFQRVVPATDAVINAGTLADG